MMAPFCFLFCPMAFISGWKPRPILMRWNQLTVAGLRIRQKLKQNRERRTCYRWYTKLCGFSRVFRWIHTWWTWLYHEAWTRHCIHDCLCCRCGKIRNWTSGSGPRMNMAHWYGQVSGSRNACPPSQSANSFIFNDARVGRPCDLYPGKNVPEVHPVVHGLLQCLGIAYVCFFLLQVFCVPTYLTMEPKVTSHEPVSSNGCFVSSRWGWSATVQDHSSNTFLKPSQFAFYHF